MFILTQPVEIYSVKLITDMVGRYAETPDSVCPMYGFLKRLQDLWHINETTADISALFEMQPDYNADKQFPMVTLEDLEGQEDADIRSLQQERTVDVEYNPNIHKTNFDGYIRHLEYLPEGYMTVYLENLTLRIRTQSNGVAAYNNKHRIQNSFIGYGDNGMEITERVDLLSDYEIDRSLLKDAENARQQLPFVVKRLHNLSRLSKIHILSFIVSFMKARKQSDKARAIGASTSQFKLNDVIRMGVWKSNEQGAPCGQVHLGDKNKNAPIIFDWAMGRKSVFSSYYDDMINFFVYCDVLSIDVLHDTMLSYDDVFMRDIFVPIVTSNSQYDKLVADAILYYRGVDVPKVSTLASDSFTEALIELHANYVNYYTWNSDLYEKYMNYSFKDRKYIYGMAVGLVRLQCVRYSIPIPADDAITWEDGLLFVNGELFKFVTNLVDSSFAGRESYCVLHDTGYMLRVEKGRNIHRVMLKVACEQVTKIHNGEATPLRWEVI